MVHEPLPPAAQAQLDTLTASAPALAAVLSPLARELVFPKDIPAQSAEAKGKRFNATIGQITDGHNHPLPLDVMARQLTGMGTDARDRGLLYSPVEGFKDVREAWSAWQRREINTAVPSSLPIVCVGLTHALSIAADIFGGPGRVVVIPKPFWGNYRQTFATRTGARLLTPEGYPDGVYDCEAIEKALAALPAGEPAVALLNLPSNPGGYSLTSEERDRVRESLRRAAELRPLVVLCDDAYAGLVYDAKIPRTSLFWELAGVHENLIPVKIDGATKELSFFGGRVGFLTFPYAPTSPEALILEDKIKCLIRATVGSPVALSQILVLETLKSKDVAAEVEQVRATLAERARVLTIALEGVDHSLLKPLPFNSGCFALVKLAPGLPFSSEDVRRRLLAEYDTGLVSTLPDLLRIAFCGVEAPALAEMVSRIEAAVRALAGR